MTTRRDLEKLLGSASTSVDAAANNAEVLALQRLLGSASISTADPADVAVAIKLLAQSLGSSVDA